MSQPITITATVGAYLTEPESDYRGVNALLSSLDNPERHKFVIGNLFVYSASDMSKAWLLAGEADITVRLMPRDEQTAIAVERLQAKLAKERAESMQRQNAILAEISKLQAITYEAEA
jgi:hypothetical protein